MARSALYERFLFFARERELFAPGERVLAAVSGGPDSVAMLDILKRFSARGRIALFACHLNHKLRGRDSSRDAEFVRTLCSNLHVPLAVAEKDVRAFAKREKLSIESAARRARYDFFLRAAREFKCSKVATAHTLSDNAETILQRLIEGTGPAGLSGIPLSRALAEEGKVSVVRPLLFATRREIEKYLLSRGLKARTDRTNLEPLYTRNRIRLEILPRIIELNPSAESSISRTGAGVVLLMNFVEDEISKARERIVERESSGKTVLRRKALLAAPEIISREIVKRAILDSGVQGREFSSAHVDAVMKLAARRRSYGTAALPGGTVATVQYENLTIAARKNDERPMTAARRGRSAARKPHENRMVDDSVRESAFRSTLPVPGTVILPGGAGRIDAKAVRKFDLAKFMKRKTRFEEVVDADSVKGELVVRFPKRGGRFRPLGAPGEKKLSDFFTDEKVPLGERWAIPVVADDEGVIWVVGYRISERVKVSPRTRRLLRLSFSVAKRKSSGVS